MDYTEAFKNLRTNNKWGRKSPHKAVLMLTVIELFEKNILTDNEILYDDKLKSIKVFSFYDFLKSMMFKRNKGNHYFISLFRKHLLSEEHLLKSHITMVLIEKKYNIDNDEKTNFFECFEKL